jgi:hypothetical protein
MYLAAAVACLCVAKTANASSLYRGLLAIVLFGWWYQLYLGLSCFFDDVRAPARFSHWLVLASILATAGLSYTLLPLDRLFRAEHAPETHRERTPVAARWMVWAATAAAGLLCALAGAAALLLVTATVLPEASFARHWATRWGILPFAGAYLVWALSLPLFLVRSFREERGTVWLWWVALSMAPIVGSVVFQAKHGDR